MVYLLHKFKHYLLGGPFKFFSGHFALKYLVNKPVLEGRIFKWLLLFQEFTFKVIMKLGSLNVGLDHLSELKLSDIGGSIDDQPSDADLFRVKAIPDYLEDIVLFLTTGKCLEEYEETQRRNMVVRVVDYQLITRQLYKMFIDQIL